MKTRTGIARKTPLKRGAPPRKRRPGPPRRGQPTPAEKDALRLEVYYRAEGRCEMNLPGVACIPGVLPFDGPTPWTHGHLVHIHAKQRFGWGKDNLLWGCWRCHEASHNAGGKPVPAKERAA